MQADINIATRIFGNSDLLNGIEYEVRDRMMRTPDGAFYLIEGPGKPGEREAVTPYSREAVFDWLNDCPFQIERAVIIGGRSASIAKHMGTRGREGVATLRLLTGTADRT